jgi:hypothetical protein
MNKKVKSILTKFKGKEKNLHYYLSGFVDGEGSFSVSIIKHSNQVFSWMINPCFQVYQHEKHRYILELFQFVFKTGSIYRKSGTHPVLNFSIDSRRAILEKVIPFFDRYPLIVKDETYKKFRTIVNMMEKKEHLQIQGFKKIVDIAFSMNQQGKGRKYSKEYIFSTLPLKNNSIQESSETIRRTRL